MAGVKKLTSYFKKLTKDEMEVDALLATQIKNFLISRLIHLARL